MQKVKLRKVKLVAAALVLSALSLTLGCTKREAQAPREALHLDLEMSAAEILQAVENQTGSAKNPNELDQTVADNGRAELKEVLDSGARLYSWLELLNSKRTDGTKLSFTSKETQAAYPIDAVRPYNIAIIKAQYADRLAVSPASLKAILLSADPLPETLPTDEATFIKWGHEISASYDIAVRWVSLIGDIQYYKRNQANDLRGYYFLSRMADRDAKLKDFAAQPAASQASIREWLTQICMNNQDWSDINRQRCVDEVAAAVTANSLVDYYAKDAPGSAELWASYFDIRSYYMRSDLTWTAAEPNVLHYPFLQPTTAPIQSYLKDNVEDEFKTSTWHLAIDYQTVEKPGLSHFEFAAGENAHAVPAKSLIVMDANQPISEYDSQWTIRHEFGHLLGFPDCYVEFYDESIQAMVNYQLDTTNLMCSRRGKFQDQHFDRLKTAYLK